MSVKKPSMDLFTCVTCNVAFENSELQRDHYKTDWHRYNLKRKVADLPAVSLQDFQERVQLQKTQLENSQNPVNDELFCKLCCKHFNTKNSFENHTQSKKHKELEALKAKQNEEPTVVKSDRSAKKLAQMEEFLKKQIELQNLEEMEDDGDKEWEDVAEEEEIDESKGIDLLTCLFCDHKSESCVEKCEHMAKEHSFFIPDMEYVSDLEGLLKFLGIKVGAYHVCLWCSNKVYRDVLSVQKHMADKGHQKLKFEGDTLLEYSDFYSYDEETDDEYEVLNESDFNSVSKISTVFDDEILDNEGFELVLPSGAKIGHRSLFKYYKQSFGHRNLELKERSNFTLRDKYKAIGSNQIYTNAEIQRQRKDMAYFKRWNTKMHAKMSCEANKLQKHFRRQDLCF